MKRVKGKVKTAKCKVGLTTERPSLALGWWVSPWWRLFTAFVGLNLIQSSFTRWCLMEDILAKVGIAKKPASGCCG